MKNWFLSPGPLWLDIGLLLVRLLTGAFMVYHGWELFLPNKMNEYSKWLTDLHFPAPAVMAYLGKGAELVGGVFLAAGFLTRLACIALAITMSLISFGMGQGRIFMEEQHPFLFVLLAAAFFFTGPGKWSLDHILFGAGKIKGRL